MKVRNYELRITDWKTTAPIAIGAVVFVVMAGIILSGSSLESEVTVTIDEGVGVYKIADILEKEGVINNKFVFVAYVLITGNEKKLQAGDYVFEAGVTIPTIARAMAKGYAENDIVVTIPEGFNVFDIDKRLASAGLIKEGEFAGRYYLDEGQFFPDTYRCKKPARNAAHSVAGGGGETPDSIAQKMKNHLNFKFEDLSTVLSTLVLYDTLTKASILEKEARKEEDMKLVAGVIENRLKKGMPLQIDATVAYGACIKQIQNAKDKNQNYKYCDVSLIGIANEIKIDGPYNTYTRTGLPPGPIANPGIIAVRAVLNPTESDYLYYLSTRDGNQMIFSKTAAEHAANRRKYLGL